jgi:hypothetical protein
MRGILATLLLSLSAVGQLFGQPIQGRVGATELAVEAFDVESVPQLTVGTRLNFSLYGTPGAMASLQIDGARSALNLSEVGAGMYEGTYIVDAPDRIGPESRVTATLRRGGLVARSVLEEPLVLGAGATFAAQPLSMPSTPPDDRRATPSRLRTGIPLPPPPSAMACADCAVVESVRAIELDDGPARAGAIAGGVAGAVFGNDIGQAHARHVQWVLGTLGHVLTGREFERPGGPHVRYEAVLRMPSGAALVYHYDTVPPFGVGDTVTVRMVPAAPARSDWSIAPF